MRWLFVGHFSPPNDPITRATSVAGDVVQKKIYNEIKEKYGNNVMCLSMRPLPAWPRGKFYSRGIVVDDVRYIGYINLFLIKNVFFSLAIMRLFFAKKVDRIVQYNSYFFENIILLLCKKINHNVILYMILQDVNISESCGLSYRARLKSALEKISMIFVKKIDWIFPVSEAIVDDFDLDVSKCCVFKGAMTDMSSCLAEKKLNGLHKVAIFAGALERYNGVDKLIDYWLKNKIQYPLQIYGHGDLVDYVVEAGKKSSSITYCGVKTGQEMVSIISKAEVNICLRFSHGIDERYFFPSKLFNLLAAPGIVITNDFFGIPSDIKSYLVVLPESLDGLIGILENTGDYMSECLLEKRRQLLLARYTWSALIEKYFQ